MNEERTQPSALLAGLDLPAAFGPPLLNLFMQRLWFVMASYDDCWGGKNETEKLPVKLGGLTLK